MDAFEDGFGGEGEVEVDPAAEFLAKEQQQLGEIGEDLGLGSPGGQEEGVIQAFQEEQRPDVDFFGGGFEAKPVEGFMGAFETEAPLAAPAPDYSSFGGEVQEVTGGMAHLSMARPSEEPECLKRWKVEQEEKLRRKDADEEEKKEELRRVAAKELADWYKQYEEQLAKTRQNNKEQEVVVSEMNGITPGQEWERVSSHCDFSAKAPGHTKDVSRMRSILLQLKQSPPTTRE